MKTKLYVCLKLVLVLFLMFLCNQLITAQQVAKSFTASNGTFIGFYEYKPVTYNANPTTKYPLIIFLHGIGERGDGTTELPYLLSQGIPRLINAGATMTFKNPTTGQNETFIVLSPQLPKWMGYWDNIYVDELLNYAKSSLRIDTNKIYLTGLSLGGGGAWAYPNTSVAHAKQFAAIAPICGVCYYNYSTLCATIGAAGLPVWGFANADDNIVTPVCTTQACDLLSSCSTDPSKIKKTIYPWGGHDAWTKAYDTGHTIQTDINMYEWFLSFSRASVTPVPNKAPVSNAGSAITITLPVNTVNLNGSASSDPDGTITNYSWAKASGPTSFSFANAAAANTAVSNLVEGVYTFSLLVTDNNGATASSTVQVTVNPAPLPVNQAPVANAGAAVSITLPTSSIVLDGSASKDPDGSIVSYSWTQASGPVSSTIVSAGAASTPVNALVAGTYVFKLTVTDNNGSTSSSTIQVIVNPAPNQAPVANAGAAMTITLPTNTITLNGTGSKDNDGSITTYNWTKVSGPATATIVNATAASTTVNNLVQGVYSFQLTVTDNSGATASASVQVTVNAAPVPVNKAPISNAGSAMAITLPTNSVTLNGTASSDADGTIASYSWTKLSGPASGTIVNPGSVSTTVNNLVEGIYSFQLTVTDNSGATASATVQVTVNAAPVPVNKAPVANAGAAITITLPTNSVTLNASASSDVDGTISGYNWTKVSGPASGTIVNATAISTAVSNLVQGVYSFQLTVTDNSGATASANVQVTVNAAPVPVNKAPVANAGAAITITLPTNSVTLNGSASSDVDGAISGYSWSKVSGPASGTIVNATAASTAVNNLVQGVYSFQLTVTDNNGAAASATVQVTVNAAPAPVNQAPVANGGNAMTIMLPTNSVTLNGSASSDADGTLTGYNWTKVSGPAAGTIVNAAVATTLANNLVEGVYSFKLVVTDNSGATASAQVQVTVLAKPNQLPVANAGADKSYGTPAGIVTLDGTKSSDPDGSIVSYNWVIKSGNGGSTISNANTATASVQGLTTGDYIFQLTVKDNSGATATDEVKISVYRVNQKPKAHAGKDSSIALPANTITVSGNASADTDGSITSYTWKQISGPAGAVINYQNNVSTVVTGLTEGEFKFELTVTDNEGASGKDTVVVSVVNIYRLAQYYSIYPNPVKDVLHVKYIFVKTGDVTLTIYDNQGNGIRSYVYSKQTSILEKSITVADLKAGFYFLEIKFSDGKSAIKQFLKR